MTIEVNCPKTPGCHFPTTICWAEDGLELLIAELSRIPAALAPKAAQMLVPEQFAEDCAAEAQRIHFLRLPNLGQPHVRPSSHLFHHVKNGREKRGTTHLRCESMALP